MVWLEGSAYSGLVGNRGRSECIKTHLQCEVAVQRGKVCRRIARTSEELRLAIRRLGDRQRREPHHDQRIENEMPQIVAQGNLHGSQCCVPYAPEQERD